MINVAFEMKATTPLAPIAGIPAEWIIFGMFVVLWAGIFLFFGRRQRRYDKQKNREIAEKLLALLPTSIQRVTTDARVVSGLVLDELRQLTSKFEALGFAQSGDYTLVFDNEDVTRGFFRLFYHHEKHCFADLGVTRKTLESHEGGFLFGISSSVHAGWAIGTSNAKPSILKYLQRLPKIIEVKDPSATQEELFTTHLELRERLARELGLEIIADPSVENYFVRSDNTRKLHREALLNRNILNDLREAKRVEQEGRWEWLGDYPQEAVKRAKGRKLRTIPENFPVYTVPQPDAFENMAKESDESRPENPNS